MLFCEVLIMLVFIFGVSVLSSLVIVGVFCLFSIMCSGMLG